MNQNIKVTQKTMILLRKEQLRRLEAGTSISLKDLLEEAVLAKYTKS